MFFVFFFFFKIKKTVHYTDILPGNIHRLTCIYNRELTQNTYLVTKSVHIYVIISTIVH